MTASEPLLCEISADDRRAADITHVIGFCAKQIGLDLDVVSRTTPEGEPVVTLHLDPEQAAPDHRVWCLVCRLACLCPQARVGVLVHAIPVFDSPVPAGRLSA